MNINTLPDDCLRLILQNLTLHQLIHLRLVCHQWYNQIELMFMEGKVSLKLFASRDDIYQYREVIYNHNIEDDSDFGLRPIGPVDDILVIGRDRVEQACAMIPMLFPNISQLLISCRPLFECDAFAAMLRQWPELISLVLSARMQHMPQQVLCAINSLSSLKRLHLTELFQSKIPDQLQVLSKLQHFTLVHYISDSVPVLAQLGPTCTELCLCWIYFSRDELARLLQVNEHLARSLKHLFIGFIATNHENRLKNFYKLFELICERFQALEHLDIVFADHLPIPLLVLQLAKLPNLNHLSMYISSNELYEDLTSSRLPYKHHLPPLLTVRTLDLEIYNISIGEFRHTIAPLFPRIQNLTIKCDFEEPNDRAEFEKMCLSVQVFPKLVQFKLRF